MASPVLQFKRGAFTNLPGLRVGEPGFTTDKYDLYVGLTSSLATNQFFGSGRYWSRENGTKSLGFNLVDKNGTNYVQLKSPDTLSGITTYTLPETPVNGAVLTTNLSGDLSWTSALTELSVSDLVIGIGTFTNNVAFTSTTGNVLGEPATGAVQVTGGVGIAKNLTVGAGLSVGSDLTVAGVSTFVGAVTFQGGTINLGDSNQDNINVGGEFTSSLVPNSDDVYDIGDGTASKRWRHASFSGVGTFATGAVADGIRIGISSATEIDTASGDLRLDSESGHTVIDDELTVVGVTTFSAATTIASASINNVQIGVSAANEIDTSSGDLVIDSATGTTTIDDELVVSGDVRINGNDIRSSDNNVNITLTSNTLTTFAGDIKVNGNDIQASDGNANISMTSNTLTTFAGDIRVGGNDIQASDGSTNIIMTGNTLTATTGDIRVGGNDIQDSNGNNVFTFDGSQNVTANNNLTVAGNLFVNGSTTQVNTSAITVEDRTIELGMVDGNPPASSTTWDLGVLFNYNSSGAKKAAVAWEHSDGRFKFASQVTDGGGTGVANPQLTFTAYAPIEISALWVNDCAGQSQVINCAGGERTLENITIDGGSF